MKLAILTSPLSHSAASVEEAAIDGNAFKNQLRLQVVYLYFCHIKRLYYLSRSKEKALEFQEVYMYVEGEGYSTTICRLSVTS